MFDQNVFHQEVRIIIVNMEAKVAITWGSVVLMSSNCGQTEHVIQCRYQYLIKVY